MDQKIICHCNVDRLSGARNGYKLYCYLSALWSLSFCILQFSGVHTLTFLKFLTIIVDNQWRVDMMSSQTLFFGSVDASNDSHYWVSGSIHQPKKYFGR